MSCKCAYPLDDKTAKILWHQSPVPTQHQLELWTYSTHPDRYHARLQVVKLFYRGWDKLSISRFLQVSRPTVDTWIARFEAEHFAGLIDKKRGPESRPQSLVATDGAGVWYPKYMPMRGSFGWSCSTLADISVRTIDSIMALNKLVYDDIPHVPSQDTSRPRSLTPTRLSIAAVDIDRQHDGFRLGWRVEQVVEHPDPRGYCRTILAGAMAPTEATWAALMVLYTACVRYGAPTYLVSDSGGAYT